MAYNIMERFMNMSFNFYLVQTDITVDRKRSNQDLSFLVPLLTRLIL